MTTAVTGKPETTEEVKLTRKSLRRYLATSDKPVPRAIRWLYLRRNRLSVPARSAEHTSELQSPCNLVCRLLLENKTNHRRRPPHPTSATPHAPHAARRSGE